MKRNLIPFSISLIGLVIALSSAISTDVFHIISRESLLGSLTFWISISISSISWCIGAYINKLWVSIK